MQHEQTMRVTHVLSVTRSDLLIALRQRQPQIANDAEIAFDNENAEGSERVLSISWTDDSFVQSKLEKREQADNLKTRKRS